MDTITYTSIVIILYLLPIILIILTMKQYPRNNLFVTIIYLYLQSIPEVGKIPLTLKMNKTIRQGLDRISLTYYINKRKSHSFNQLVR